MGTPIKPKRGTRAGIDAAAGANGLVAGEIYFITDESRLAMGTSASTYETFAKESEAGGGDAFTVSEHGATEGQTTFTVGNYDVGGILVYLNGVKLAAADYSATNGTQIVLASGAVAGDLLTVVRSPFLSGGSISTEEFMATASQTSFAVTGGYTAGKIMVFQNGVLLSAADYTATNGTTVVLAAGATAGDLLTVYKT